jgi:hypothetical protein
VNLDVSAAASYAMQILYSRFVGSAPTSMLVPVSRATRPTHYGSDFIFRRALSSDGFSILSEVLSEY